MRRGAGVTEARRPGLVVLPGLAATHDHLSLPERALQRLILRRFARRFTITAIERRVGLAPGTTLADLGDDAATAIPTRVEAPVDVMGISTGGGIALALGIDHPDVVRRLVVVASAYRLGERGRSEQARIARLARDRSALRALLEGQVPPGVGARAVGGLVRVLERAGQRRDPSDMVATIRAEEAMDLRDQLGRITAPTLVVGGGDDGPYGADLMRATADAIPGAQLILYPRRGHVATLLDRRLAADVAAFLSGAPPEEGAGLGA